MAQNVTAMMKLIDQGRAYHYRVMAAPLDTLTGRDLEYRKEWDAHAARLSKHMDEEFDRIFGAKAKP